jgi:hypothetical protein
MDRLLSSIKLHGPDAAWPGPAAGGGVVLPLCRPALADLPEQLAVDDGSERRMRRKPEFHLTLFNRVQWQSVLACHGEPVAQAAFERLDWTLRADGRCWLVEDDGDASVVASLDAPALVALRRALALEPPTPHVTLYWHRSPDGIGLSGPAQWRQRVRGELAVDWVAGRGRLRD